MKQWQSSANGVDLVVLPFRFYRICDMDVHMGSWGNVAFDIFVNGKCNFETFVVIFYTVTVIVKICHNDECHYVTMFLYHNKKCLYQDRMNNLDHCIENSSKSHRPTCKDRCLQEDLKTTRSSHHIEIERVKPKSCSRSTQMPSR